MADAISVDDAFLQKFLDSGGKAETPTGTPVDKDNVDAFLANEPAAGKAEKTRRQKNSVEKEPTAEEKRKISDEKLRSAEEVEGDEASKSTLDRIGETTRTAVEPLVQKANSAADRIGSLPTMGGIGLLLAVLMIILFTVVIVNKQGDTRLKMLWYMLVGRTTLQGRVNLQAQDQSTLNEVEQGASNLASAFTAGVESTISTTANTVEQQFSDIGNWLGNEFRTITGQ